MKTYDVVIYETVRKVFEVQAESQEEAEDCFEPETLWGQGYTDEMYLVRKQVVDYETINVVKTPPGILRRRKKARRLKI